MSLDEAYQEFLKNNDSLDRDTWESIYTKGMLAGMEILVNEAEIFDEYEFAVTLAEELRYIYNVEQELQHQSRSA
jgi:hypothetical protein